MKRVLTTWAIAFVGMSAQAQTYPVVWTQPIVNVTVNADNTLTKSAGGTAWNAGAVSENTLTPGVDGYVQFTHVGGTNQYMVGLSGLNTNQDFDANKYSLYVTAQNTLTIYKSASGLATLGALAIGDVLKMGREGQLLKVYKNGTQIFSNDITTNQEVYRVDVNISSGSVPVIVTSFRPLLSLKPTITPPGLANNDGSIVVQPEGFYAPVTYSWSSGETTSSITGKPRGTYTVTATDAQGRSVTRAYSLGYAVEWTNMTNTMVNPDNSLSKTDAPGWTAGASTTNILAANTDGWVEFVVREPGPAFMIGLSYLDEGPNYGDINYAWYLYQQNNWLIYEAGTGRGTQGFLQKGDVLRVAREGGFMKYYLNGVEKRSVAISVTARFVVDVAINSGAEALPIVNASFGRTLNILPNITLPDANNQGGGVALTVKGTYPPVGISWTTGETAVSISGKSRNTYTVSVTDGISQVLSRSYRLGYGVKWKNLQGTTVSGLGLAKTTTSTLWDAGAISSDVLAPNTNGWVEFIQPADGSTFMVGLSRPNAAPERQSVDYGFQVSSGTLFILENGVIRTYTGVATVTPGDVYTIARENGFINYYRNGVSLRSIATNVSYTLAADVSVSVLSSPQVSASFGQSAPATYYAIADGAWTSPSTWSLTDGGSAGILFPGSQDQVVIKGHKVTMATGNFCSGVVITTTNAGTSLNIDGSEASLTVQGAVKVKGANNNEVADALLVKNGGTIAIINP